jgi:formiminoglutamate deiminase
MKYFLPYAWLPDGLTSDVLLEVVDGRYTEVTAGAAPDDAERLPGVGFPGFANGHSHAFHRALRGRTHAEGGSFWTWRNRMYAVAARLDPDSYLDLARGVYAEMALAGVTAVGEFHYLHHGPEGVPYDDPNAMSAALVQAASEAGIRLTLLETCYLAGGLGPSGHRPPDSIQRRFADPDVAAWIHRFEALRPGPGVAIGAAVHSVRATPGPAIPPVVAAARGLPLHVHLSEQPAENDACLAFYHRTPTAQLAAAGALGPMTTVVHATHLTAADIDVLGTTGATACFCPSTEQDLADGIGPARRLHDAGVPLSLGSDQHAVIDLLHEAQALELDQRLASGRRGRFAPSELVAALTRQASIGWPDAGRLEVGARADLVVIRTDTVRTAGTDPAQVVLSAGAADVDTVLVDGVVVVSGGAHRLGDVASLLRAAIDPIWERSR